ncbi:MAG: DUF4976 domain-containing protein, partial [Bacteroidales bacterium]|nr:DUF4976 domain-containing protein [Bacteroidales bacterium]
ATTLITDMAIEWIRDRDKDKPFCILVHHKAPHRNWMPDTLDFDLFDEEEFSVPANYFDNYEGRKGAELQKMSIYKDMRMAFDLKITGTDDDSISQSEKDYISFLKNRLTPQQYEAWQKEYEAVSRDYNAHPLTGDSLAVFKLRRYLADYLRTVQSVDRNTGRLLEYIDSAGLRDNTIIVYTSDQGFYLGEHGWFDKRFMYEESFRTPLVMRLPQGYKARGEIVEMVQNIDLAPTFLELAGVRPPEEMQGMSLVPLLRGPGVKKWRDALYYHYYEYPGEHDTRPHYGVRTDRYKLIHFYGDTDHWELYDLAEDPHEMKNLINESSYDNVEESLRKRLDELRLLYNVPVTE